MKKKLLFLFSLISFQIHAQVIDSIYVVPANPTTSDLISVFVDCRFNLSSCSTHTQGYSFLTASDIGAWALHCLDTISVICYHTDTFAIGLLSAGNYTFTFQLDEGHGLPTCTPGIVPGPSEVFNFTVSVPTPVQESEENSFAIYPNPAAEELKIKHSELRIEEIAIYNVMGEKILCQKLTANSQQQTAINVSHLSPGIYIAELKGENFSRRVFSVQR